MPHAKSQGHRPSGSGEEDFLRVFTKYGRGRHLGHVTKTIWTNFRSPILGSLHMKYEFNWPSSFRGEDVWKWWRTTDDGRTPDAGVTGILLAHQWAFGSGELKINTLWCNSTFCCISSRFLLLAEVNVPSSRISKANQRTKLSKSGCVSDEKGWDSDKVGRAYIDKMGVSQIKSLELKQSGQSSHKSRVGLW